MRVNLIISIAVCFMLLGGESVFAQTGKDKAALTSASETEQSAITFDELDEFVALIENRQVRMDLTLQSKLQGGTNMLVKKLNEDSPQKLGHLIGRIFSINNGDSGTVENGITTTFSPGIAILEALEKSPPPDMLPYLGRVYVDNATSIGGANRPTMKRLAVFLQNTVGEVPEAYRQRTSEEVIPMAFQVRIAERLLAQRRRKVDELIEQVSKIDLSIPHSPENDWNIAYNALEMAKRLYLRDDPYLSRLSAAILERLPKEGSSEEEEFRKMNRDKSIAQITSLRRKCNNFDRYYMDSRKKREVDGNWDMKYSIQDVKDVVWEVEYSRTNNRREYEAYIMPGELYELNIDGLDGVELSLLQDYYCDAQRKLDALLTQSPPNPYSQWQAVRLMGKMLDINTTPTLISIIEAPDVCPLTMCEGMLALGKIGGSGVQEYLWKVLQRPLSDTVNPESWSDPEIERRASAAEALGHAADRENYKEVFSNLGKVSMGSSAISRGSVKGRRIIGQRFGMPIIRMSH